MKSKARKRQIQDKESGNMLTLLNQLYPDCKNRSKKIIFQRYGKAKQRSLSGSFQSSADRCGLIQLVQMSGARGIRGGVREKSESVMERL